ncbi:Uncharacterised protein [BD1-7 clade bacterium]|uniref:Uncharacterized protein n=1 Tax=BD1-7 clade bacterium TaxID=2029982 RepID=A0A5S9PDK7_9GAMM|nr:Uncharacterised protein [BD1-7 clade bacterium]
MLDTQTQQPSQKSVKSCKKLTKRGLNSVKETKNAVFRHVFVTPPRPLLLYSYSTAIKKQPINL